MINDLTSNSYFAKKASIRTLGSGSYPWAKPHNNLFKYTASPIPWMDKASEDEFNYNISHYCERCCCFIGFHNMFAQLTLCDDCSKELELEFAHSNKPYNFGARLWDQDTTYKSTDRTIDTIIMKD